MRRMVFGAGTFEKRSGRCLLLEDTARIRKKVATLKSGERQVSFRQTKASSPRLIPRLGGRVRVRAELVSSCSPDKATLPRRYLLPVPWPLTVGSKARPSALAYSHRPLPSVGWHRCREYLPDSPWRDWLASDPLHRSYR